MSYLPDIYKHFERAFPTVHAAHQELARRCYEVGPLDEQMRPEELRYVGLLALTTIGFPHTVAGLGWIEEVIESTS